MDGGVVVFVVPGRVAGFVAAGAVGTQIIDDVAVEDVRFDAELGETERVRLLDVITRLSVDVRACQTHRSWHRERYASEETFVSARDGFHDK